MKRTLTFRLGFIIIGVIFATVIINSITTYKTAYDSLYEAAGVEAYGCANITTGLLDTQDIQDLQNGNRSEEIGEKLNWTIDHKDIFENHYILSMDGEILALDDNLREQGFEIGDKFYIDNEAIEMLKEMNHSTYSEIYEFGGMERISGYAPIYKDHDVTQEIIAISVIDFDAKIVTERTWAVVQDGIIMGIIPLLIAAAITLYLIRRKTKPISILIERTRMIAEGNISESDINIKSNDEVGDLARNLEEMSKNLRQVITTIKETSENLVESANDTSTSMNDMKLALGHVSNNMEEVAAGTLEGAEMTVDSSKELVNLAELIHKSSEKVDISVKSAENTMETARSGIQKVNEIVQRMNAIKSSSGDTKQNIEKLNAYTHEIEQITETITRIANQTNLLALNAAIEAARAGEHGKGFAVVANEIRQLAEQSNKEALEVENIVTKITTSVMETVESIEESHKNVEAGEQEVNETGEALENIRIAVKNIVEEISSLSKLTHDEAETSEQIVQHVQRLEKVNEDMATSAEEVSARTEESTASIEEVATRSYKLAEMSKKLNEIVNKFKL